MKMRRCVSWILCAQIVLFSLTACGTAGETESQVSDPTESQASGEIESQIPENGDSTEGDGYIEDSGEWNCAWYVYWDTDVWDEFLVLTEDVKLSAVSMFSCYFSEDGQLYVPQGISTLEEIAQELAFPVVYLSFTNDVQHADGSATQKDPEFLKDMWADEERTEETAEEMLAMAKSVGADGIEIDFENIKEQELWAEYARFLELVRDKAQAEGLSMRVVLGVNAPVKDFTFPTGPEYSVMCYNLYGTHSGPGPKADTDFLKETAEMFSKLQNVTYALATGGFEWNGDDAVTRSLTQEAAEALAEEYECKIGRDKPSGDLYYIYQENGEMFTVWYADRQTLAVWRSAILSVDPDARFDLWRVGGNRWQ